MSLISIDTTKLATKKEQEAERNRKEAYFNESDPLFFKAQRGDTTMQEWLDKVSEIKARFPKQ
jgi:hypothetical protein